MSTSVETTGIPQDFICPITQTIMDDPLVTKDGFCFERAAILEWIYTNGTCPLTRRPLSSSQLVSNHALRSRIQNWCQVQNVNNANDLESFNNASCLHLINIRKKLSLARRNMGTPMSELVCA